MLLKVKKDSYLSVGRYFFANFTCAIKFSRTFHLSYNYFMQQSCISTFMSGGV